MTTSETPRPNPVEQQKRLATVELVRSTMDRIAGAKFSPLSEFVASRAIPALASGELPLFVGSERDFDHYCPSLSAFAVTTTMVDQRPLYRPSLIINLDKIFPTNQDFRLQG